MAQQVELMARVQDSVLSSSYFLSFTCSPRVCVGVLLHSKNNSEKVDWHIEIASKCDSGCLAFLLLSIMWNAFYSPSTILFRSSISLMISWYCLCSFAVCVLPMSMWVSSVLSDFFTPPKSMTVGRLAMLNCPQHVCALQWTNVSFRACLHY